MRKILLGAVAVLGLFGLVALASPAAADGASTAASVQSVAQYQARQQNPAAAPAAVQLATCPAGDGSATWGDGKVCPDATYGARVHLRDSLTDGYCVRAYYWSSDNSVWTPTGTQACTTGQWITFGTSAGKMCNPDARLYRGSTGQFFTMPNTAC